MKYKAPIGIFDSGVGGLSIARAVRRQLPTENIIYVADSGFAPYGEKSTEVITSRCFDIVEFLLSKKAKAIVVACNTATVSTISDLRAHFSLPIIGVEPGVKMAVMMKPKGKIGVLATTQTVKSASVARLIKEHAAQDQVYVQACPGLVEAIEGRKLKEPQIIDLLTSFIKPLLDEGVDRLVLGCTHYAFLLPLIHVVVREETDRLVEVLTTHDAVASQLSRRLKAAEILNETDAQGSNLFYSSGITSFTADLFSDLWGKRVEVASYTHKKSPEKII